MNKKSRIGLMVIVGALALCCIIIIAGNQVISAVFGQATTRDSTRAAKIGHEIVDYALPVSYHEIYAMSAFGLKQVVIGPRPSSSDAMTLTLVQFSGGANSKQIEQQMQWMLAQEGQQSGVQMKTIGTQNATIRGQLVTLTVHEGDRSDGRIVRSVAGVFSGKDNTAVMITVLGTKDAWNAALLTDFMASIK